jgi:hypothetical protein
MQVVAFSNTRGGILLRDLYLEEYVLCEKGILPVHGMELFSGLDDQNLMN